MSSSLSSVVNEILLLNNEGVCLLQEQEQNQTESAIARFTQAMYLASEVLPREFPVTGNNNINNNNNNIINYTANDDDDDEEDCFLDTYNNNNNNDNEVPVVSLVSIGETPVTTNNNNVADNDYAMFDRAFLFTGNPFGRVNNEVVLDTVLLYNVGIAYHRLVVTTANNNKRESLQNAHAALRCYKCGVNLIRHANDKDNHHNPMQQQQQQQQESLFLLALATLNNLAHLFWFCSRPADALVCREMLDALLESWHIPESYMSKEDVDFFYFGKVCRATGVVMATAAAAA